MKAHLDAVRPKKGHHVFENMEGRPTKEELVMQYRAKNPEATRYKCAMDTGMAYKTVCKWWRQEAGSSRD